MATDRLDEYLETIYKLEQEEHHVRSVQVSSHLNVSPPSASEMLGRMHDNGYINIKKGSVCLTKKGEKAAKKIIRKHRLSERFLVDLLGMSIEEAHDEACKLEHAISDKVEESLAKKLGEPSTCPHGHPIPDKHGKILAEKLVKLDSLKNGDQAVIKQVYEEDSKMLQYLASLGLLPETKIKVIETAPFGGPIMIQVAKAKYALGQTIASRIEVKKK